MKNRILPTGEEDDPDEVWRWRRVRPHPENQPPGWGRHPRPPPPPPCLPRCRPRPRRRPRRPPP